MEQRTTFVLGAYAKCPLDSEIGEVFLSFRPPEDECYAGEGPLLMLISQN
jgi:hypothetical protein